MTYADTMFRRLPWIVSVSASGVLVLATGCSSADGSAISTSPSPSSSSTQTTQTPVLVTIPDAPIPFAASDGKTRLSYELHVTNATSGAVTIDQIDVVDAHSDALVARLGKAEIAGDLQLLGSREPSDSLPTAASGLLFIDLALDAGMGVPDALEHKLTATVAAAPPAQRQITESTPAVTVNKAEVISVANPLRGQRYVSADSCCDSYRHRRAALPLNNRIWLAQRYAVDWEQLDGQGRLYAGARRDVTSYAIYGKDVHAVADGTVVAAVDGMPDQIPGQPLKDVTVQTADGNHVVLDLGGGRYALFAHFAPGSVMVNVGDRVTTGQVLGKVGNTGNSSAPHLHFHVMDGASPLTSNGLPYQLRDFEVTAQVAGNTAAARTTAFDTAEADGTVLRTTGGSQVGRHHNQLPLNQLIVTLN